MNDNKKGIWYRDYTKAGRGEWVFTTNSNEIKINECLQELLLWKGENDFFSDVGVAYLDVFSGNISALAQIEVIVDGYKPFFKDISVQRIYEKDMVSFNIIFTKNDNQSESYVLSGKSGRLESVKRIELATVSEVLEELKQEGF